MTKIYFNSFAAIYLRPSYPIDTRLPRTVAQKLSSCAAALIAGMVTPPATASKDAAQRRKERLLREVSEGLEAQARPVVRAH